MDKLSLVLQLYSILDAHESYKVIATWQFSACRYGPFDKWCCLSLRERCIETAPFAEQKATIGYLLTHRF